MEALFQSIVDCINSTEVNLGNATYRLVVAMVLGTLVGAERKRKGQIAGVRTFALISMGACLAMLLSMYRRYISDLKTATRAESRLR